MTPDVIPMERAPDRCAPNLGVVGPTPPGVRARLLWDEARLAAREHLDEVNVAIATAHERLMQVAEGGDVYGPGLRDLAGRMAAELDLKSRTLRALAERQAMDFLRRRT
jgi:hypothetical protein